MPTYQELRAKNDGLIEGGYTVEMLKAYIVELEAAQFETAKELNAQLDAANERAESRWENSKAYAKCLEERVGSLTNDTGGPLYLREFSMLMYIADMPWWRRVWAVFTGFNRPKGDVG